MKKGPLRDFDEICSPFSLFNYEGDDELMLTNHVANLTFNELIIVKNRPRHPAHRMTVLWYLTSQCHPKAILAVCKYFQVELYADMFRTAPERGSCAGQTGFWNILEQQTAGLGQEIWDLLESLFYRQLRLDDFRATSRAGTSAGQSGIYLALQAAVANNNSKPWQFIEKHFFNELTHDDLEAQSRANKTVLHLYCCYKHADAISLARLLVNCKGLEVRIADILRDLDVAPLFKETLVFYNRICDLGQRLDTKQSRGSQLQKILDDLVNQAALRSFNHQQQFKILLEDVLLANHPYLRRTKVQEVESPEEVELIGMLAAVTLDEKKIVEPKKGLLRAWPSLSELKAQVKPEYELDDILTVSDSSCEHVPLNLARDSNSFEIEKKKKRWSCPH